MSSIFRRFTILVLAILSFAVFGHGQTAVRSKDLRNLYKVNANFYRGGQPTEAGIRQLKAMGIRAIIDLRGNDDRSKKEERWVRAAGMRFINVHESNWRKPTNKSIDGILKQIDITENQPVFVHCKRGSDRTGTVVAVYRITHDGWSAKQANDEAKKFGFGWWQVWMRDYINDYYRDFRNHIEHTRLSPSKPHFRTHLSGTDAYVPKT